MSEKLNWGPRSVRLLSRTPRTLSGEVVRRLRHDIIVNKFQPGERLVMSKLTAAYDVGSSPVREALFQVASEGLIRLEAHRGFHVAPIDEAEMLDISTLRAELEASALSRSIKDGDHEWEQRVTSACDALGVARAGLRRPRASAEEASDEWELRHRQFHYALCSDCRSPWLLYFIDTLYDHLERYRRYFWNYGKRADGADDEHALIADAAIARNTKLAIRLLKSHFQTQAELSLAAGASTDEQHKSAGADHD